MAAVDLRAEQPVQYFREMVDAAIVHQHVHPSVDIAGYVAQMLAGFVRPAYELTLAAMRVTEGSTSEEQRASLQRVGDFSLFVSGFFSDSLDRRWLGVADLVRVGGTAYCVLSRDNADERQPVFAELSRRFVLYVAVLEEVSERSACGSNRSLLRLYNKWLRTRNHRTEAVLVEHGLVPPDRPGRPN